jgi:hypothetical protein
MKTIFTLVMPALTVAAAIASNKMFIQGEYLGSAAFTVTAYLAASVFISMIPSRKIMAR